MSSRDAATALRRFGLGPRPGEIKSISGDPRGFVLAALAPIEDIYTGGRVEIVNINGRPNVVLIPFAQRLKWGP